MTDHNPVSPGAWGLSCRCWQWRLKRLRAGQSRLKTSRRRSHIRYRLQRCRTEWGAAGKWAGSEPILHGRTETESRKKSGSSLKTGQKELTYMAIWHFIIQGKQVPQDPETSLHITSKLVSELNIFTLKEALRTEGVVLQSLLRKLVILGYRETYLYG